MIIMPWEWKKRALVAEVDRDLMIQLQAKTHAELMRSDEALHNAIRTASDLREQVRKMSER